MVLRPIIQKFLEPTNLLMLRWRNGVTFHRVELAENVSFWPWFAIDSAGTAVTIAADTGQGELSFLDPRNTSKDILYLKTQVDSSVVAHGEAGGMSWLLHGAIGLWPMGRHLRAYIKYPKGGHIYGKPPEVGAIQPTVAGNFFGFDGIMSPYRNPTNYRELWIPPQTEVTAEFYNDHVSEVIRPVCNLMFQLLHIENLNPVGENYERELCEKMAQGRVTSAFAPMGPSAHLRDYTFSRWKFADGHAVKAVRKTSVARGEL